MSENVSTIAHPAATVVVWRDGEEGGEVLLVRRNAQLAFHGGAWVFPGGRIDPADYHGAPDPRDVVRAARRAAVREAREEAGVLIADESLVPVSRWVTPEGLPKRFDTWFFVARDGGDAVRVDGGEIHEHRWMRPADALAAQRTGAIDLPPPTFVTLTKFTDCASVAEALAAAQRGPFEEFLPRLHVIPDGACTVYAGDAAYDNGDIDQPGPRHRLWMRESGWCYERSDH
jgi:8-oxo-dGTP pyrophosphatase MutT (NUDIX family)